MHAGLGLEGLQEVSPWHCVLQEMRWLWRCGELPTAHRAAQQHCPGHSEKQSMCGAFGGTTHTHTYIPFFVVLVVVVATAVVVVVVVT